jgi:hypothetical protein
LEGEDDAPLHCLGAIMLVDCIEPDPESMGERAQELRARAMVCLGVVSHTLAGFPIRVNASSSVWMGPACWHPCICRRACLIMCYVDQRLVARGQNATVGRKKRPKLKFFPGPKISPAK